MNKTLIAFAAFFVSSSAAHAAQVYYCNDERDSSYSVKINVDQGLVTVYQNGRQQFSESGTFLHCTFIGADRGAVEDTTECKFVPAGASRSIGTISIRTEASTYYNLKLDDRSFRGSCN